MEVQEAIRSRRSVRRFLSEPVPQEAILRILEGARYSPSGHNVQAWRVFVVTGQAKARVSSAVLKALDGDPDQTEHQPEFKYYPTRWVDPFLSRKRKVGFGLYGLLGIAREDVAARAAQMRQNYEFFNAPVALFVTIDRNVADATGTFMDVGMFIQSILIGARGEGLHTCAQACFNWYHKEIRASLALADREMLVCGISLGYEDTAAVVNGLRVEKRPVADFAVFVND